MLVLPSAPQEPRVYPELPQHDFRMQKANEVSAVLIAEVVHYRAVAKNINVPKRPPTGALSAPVCFQLYCQVLV